jgi:hypothetical protein
LQKAFLYIANALEIHAHPSLIHLLCVQIRKRTTSKMQSVDVAIITAKINIAKEGRSDNDLFVL